MFMKDYEIKFKSIVFVFISIGNGTLMFYAQ